MAVAGLLTYNARCPHEPCHCVKIGVMSVIVFQWFLDGTDEIDKAMRNDRRETFTVISSGRIGICCES
jgi:hypothetical protein